MANDFTYCLSSGCPQKGDCLRFIDPESDALARKPLAAFYRINSVCPMFIDLKKPRAVPTVGEAAYG